VTVTPPKTKTYDSSPTISHGQTISTGSENRGEQSTVEVEPKAAFRSQALILPLWSTEPSALRCTYRQLTYYQNKIINPSVCFCLLGLVSPVGSKLTTSEESSFDFTRFNIINSGAKEGTKHSLMI
jgi:hypothetical protein